MREPDQLPINLKKSVSSDRFSFSYMSPAASLPGKRQAWYYLGAIR